MVVPNQRIQPGGIQHRTPLSFGTWDFGLPSLIFLIPFLFFASRRVNRRKQNFRAAAKKQSALDIATAKYEKYIMDRGGKKAIKRIVVANNGMAATKFIMSVRRWTYQMFGSSNVIHFVAMVTPDDLKANADYIRLADSYSMVPGGKNINNYANVDLIVATAVEQHADCVWPGWGHASENPDLPKQLKQLGIIFAGPTEPVMSVLGDKVGANILAQTAGVPAIPWSGDGLVGHLDETGHIPQEVYQQGLVHTAKEALDAGNRIGYPVMVKASEGGGGKGIRCSNSSDEVENHFTQVQAELPGSPVFMMQYCSGARHIEVQIVGDEYGNCVALNGRDCSTQRRFQKIFEEAPPIIVPPDIFKKMERAAQHLCRNIGYIGAGTVEYLYDPDTQSFYFLELNPRLQVEHPVTEGITGCNVPALQVQVACGVPLQEMTDIRNFYDKPTGDIDFMNDEYRPITNHVIAARITGENADDGFRPTSGQLERIRFQGSPKTWGYFAIGPNGSIHEFSDSQFGHIFASGADREEARQELRYALQNTDVYGEIRTPIEYLIELLGKNEFKDNEFSTGWLDGLIASRQAGEEPKGEHESPVEPVTKADIVLSAAVYQAILTKNANLESVVNALDKFQVAEIKQKISELKDFKVETVYDNVRYRFEFQLTGPSSFNCQVLDANDGILQEIPISTREQPDGSVMIVINNQVSRVSGVEDVFGLRIRVGDRQTVSIPKAVDPSELRSEVNGKLVRYLKNEGDVIQKGDVFCELEAMKMIMEVRTPEAGIFSPTIPPGALVQAGSLIGKLDLGEATVVKLTENTEGFDLSDSDWKSANQEPISRPLLEEITDALAGYSIGSVETKIQEYLNSLNDTTYLATVEEWMTKLIKDDVLFKENDFYGSLRQLLIATETNADVLPSVVSVLGNSRVNAWMAILRNIQTRSLIPPLKHLISQCLDVNDSQIRVAAKSMMAIAQAPALDEYLASLRQELQDLSMDDLLHLRRYRNITSGTDLLMELQRDEDPEIRKKALFAYIRRVYRQFDLPGETMRVSSPRPNETQSYFNFRVSDQAPMRTCHLYVGSGLEAIQACLDECELTKSKRDNEHKHGGELNVQDEPLNCLQIVLMDPALRKQDLRQIRIQIEEILQRNRDRLKQLDARHVTVMLSAEDSEAQGYYHPRYTTFILDNDWREKKERRDMRSTFAHVLELNSFVSDYDCRRVQSSVKEGAYIYLGKKAKHNRLFGRFVATEGTLLGGNLSDASRYEDLKEKWTDIVTSSLEEIRWAYLHSEVAKAPLAKRIAADIFIHHLPTFDQADQEFLIQVFPRLLKEILQEHASTFSGLKVDNMEVKLQIRNDPLVFRVSPSLLDVSIWRRETNLINGEPIPSSWIPAESGPAHSVSPTDPIAERRSLARQADSAFVYDFISLFETALRAQWKSYAGEVPKMLPENLIDAQEMELDENGELQFVKRDIGLNKCGMVAWLCTLNTPEMGKRQVVLVGNDVSFKAGSFGLKEDYLYNAASKYARERGLPKVYLSNNSGARLEVLDQVKDLIEVAWHDSQDPTKGYSYLFVSKENFEKLPKGSINGVWRDDRFELTSIVGHDKMTMGVETLKGSAMIAGETSRAYDEAFTLSYISGRSVGIGAYINRLGQRIIQRGPLLLTGYMAINKLLGREVFSSQEQLGGPEVMLPNGIAHIQVDSDYEACGEILKWLSFVPKTAFEVQQPQRVPGPQDPVDRDVEFTPSKQAYDPRHLIMGDGEKTGLFDKGTFQETLRDWGQTVVTGRARLGGVPMGVIAVETRPKERIIPADPANAESRQVVETQAGQVWYPDSAAKTAQAIRDFNRGENLPLMILANWRGFSGGTRDMYNEVLKFGAEIVDALVGYKHPVFIYIPPYGELRGGAWAVTDPAINPEVMEMYADPLSRGGILEPAGVAEIKFRKKDLVKLMEKYETDLTDAKVAKLLPVYQSVAEEFADLHDRTDTMKATGVIKQDVPWKDARRFFAGRLIERLREFEARKK